MHSPKNAVQFLSNELIECLIKFHCQNVFLVMLSYNPNTFNFLKKFVFFFFTNELSLLIFFSYINLNINNKSFEKIKKRDSKVFQ